jgi:hypothetical protein
MHRLAIVLNSHLNGEPGRHYEQGIDSRFPKASPMNLGTLVSFLATQPEGLFMLTGSLIQAQNSLHRIAHPEFFFIGL